VHEKEGAQFVCLCKGNVSKAWHIEIHCLNKHVPGDKLAGVHESDRVKRVKELRAGVQRGSLQGKNKRYKPLDTQHNKRGYL
jgi:hypothetical protein